MNKEQVLHNYSPLALAYLGDGAYELYVRTYILEQGNCPNQKLHQKAQQYVNCAAQERFLNLLLPDLTEMEQEVVRRGRNAKSNSKPKVPTTAPTTPPPALRPCGAICTWPASGNGWTNYLIKSSPLG